MRVLFYNWVDYLDDEGRGGGVSVYQRNLIEALDAHGGVESIFLSAGLSHDLVSRRPRWERMRHGSRRDRHRRYEIVNSGVQAPAHHSFGAAGQIDDAATRAVFLDFVARTGPYDVVHFNNLEGLPAQVLEGLKRRFPATRVILSLHNYYPFCPQVNFWRRESAHCDDDEGGRRCATCLPHLPDLRAVRMANALAYRLKTLGARPGRPAFDLTFGAAMALARRLVRLRRRRARPAPAPAPTIPAGRGFAARRGAMAKLINAHCDRVLCVSARTRAVAAHHGIDPAILRTCPIGTVEAERFAETRPRESFLGADGTLTLCYLGYMRRDKGFFFLLDALEALPAAMAARLRLVVAARDRDGGAARLAALRPRLAGLVHRDGYTHGQLDTLLSGVGAGVVPVLWEDNLPQVAIEMHARHIPLLTSDLGGAQELGNCPEMVFPAGSIEGFRDRIAALLDGRIDLARYWRSARAPQTMAAHVETLLAVYGDRDGAAAACRKQALDVN